MTALESEKQQDLEAVEAFENKEQKTIDFDEQQTNNIKSLEVEKKNQMLS